eukprot:3462965-Pyramimonas_sp.AAC.1
MCSEDRHARKELYEVPGGWPHRWGPPRLELHSAVRCPSVRLTVHGASESVLPEYRTSLHACRHAPSLFS